MTSAEGTPPPARVQLLGDARSGKFADNLAGFGRALRRAGLPVDSSRIALAQQAALAVGVAAKDDLRAALEAVLVASERDLAIYRDMFDAWFRDPQVAHKLLAQMLPTTRGQAPADRRPRVREALAPRPSAERARPRQDDTPVEFDAAMTASDAQRLRTADFNQLSLQEFHLVERLARSVPLPLPQYPSRRTRPARRGRELHWPRLLREAARSGGDAAVLPRRARRTEALPLLVLLDVSGSMERYARLLLAFLHSATRGLRRRDVFAFGTRLTDLGDAFRLRDTDAMLAAAASRIDDFAGGTRLGEALATLRAEHARRLVGRRTLVLLISDGLDTGDPVELSEGLDWLRRHSGPLLWLNPLLRFAGYTPAARGAAVLHRHADRMLAVHNIESLQALADAIARLLRPR
ncbi:MAG: VWA domain-containing protein [Burkholderiales bacterium]|nr:VWA domain-containing protein [Burkholderiales bacterium]